MARPKSQLTEAEKKEKKRNADRLRRQMRINDPELLEDLRLKEKLRYLKRKAEGKIKLIKDRSKREQRRQRTKWRENTATYRMKMMSQEGDISPTLLPIDSAVPNFSRESSGRKKGEQRTTEQSSDGDESRSSSTPKHSRSSTVVPQPPTKKLKELDPIARQNELLKLACDLLSTNCKQEETNEYLDIGRVWGTKLMSLDSTQRRFAEKAINDILFEADLGTLQRDSVQINSNYNSDPLGSS